MQNPFSWDYLTTPIHQMKTLGPLSTALLALYIVVFLGAGVALYLSDKRFKNHKLNRDTLTRFCQWLMWATGVGLVFFAIRLSTTPMITLERRIWLYMTFVAFLAVIAYIIYYMRSVYPVKLAEFERNRERRSWQQAAKRRGGQRERHDVKTAHARPTRVQRRRSHNTPS